MKALKFKRTGLVAMLAASLLGSSQIAAAYDGYDRNGYQQNSYYNGPYQRSYPGYDRAYGYNQPRMDYRNSSYYRDRYDDGRYRYSGGDYGYGYRDDYSYGYSERSPGKSAAIVGGTAAAGAIFGGLAGGGKGAAIGAIVGGLGGLIFDQATKDRHRY